jgi:hypothetical protein
MGNTYGKRVTIGIAFAASISLVIACADSVDSGSSGLVSRPAVDLTGTWTGTWEFTTCNAGSQLLMPCNDDSDCDGVAGACSRPAAMCNEGEYTERACATDADCPDDAVGGVPGPPIVGACEAGDYGGSVDLTLVQGSEFRVSEEEYAANVNGSPLFNGSPCWNPDRWDPNFPGYGDGTFPWDPPIFTATLSGTEVGDSRVFLLKGDPAYVVDGGIEKVPDVVLASVSFAALGNEMHGPLSVPNVPNVIGNEAFSKGPYDPILYAEATVCVGRLGNASVTRK